MIFDDLGLPKEIGATDKNDSSRLAGIMTVFEWPRWIDCALYFDNVKRRYVRHPDETKYDFSRDQTLCLVAGLWKQGLYNLVSLKYVDGKDIFLPHHRGHLRRCAGEKASWLQDAFLWLDVLLTSHISTKGESNKLLCMLMVADKKYLKYYLKHCKDWQANIREYWCSWRQESELAEHMISKLEALA